MFRNLPFVTGFTWFTFVSWFLLSDWRLIGALWYINKWAILVSYIYFFFVALTTFWWNRFILKIQVRFIYSWINNIGISYWKFNLMLVIAWFAKRATARFRFKLEFWLINFNFLRFFWTAHWFNFKCWFIYCRANQFFML